MGKAQPDEQKQIRQFSVAMAVVLSVFGSISLYKGGNAYPYLYGIAGAFAAVGLALPAVTKPVFKVWMKLAHALGWFNTRLLLSLVFFLVFTPVGIVTRILRIDFLDRKWPRPDRDTYWRARPPADPRREDPYERQF